jgi:hypothetical protein
MNSTLFLTGLILFSAISGVGAAPAAVHLTWEGDPTSSVTVSWQTSSVTEGVVEYGKALPYGFKASDGHGTMHHVRLTGLEPGTIYHYRCGCEGDWSSDSTFRTAPADDRAFSFVAFGDSRTNWDIWGECSEAVLASGAEFSVHTGDLVEQGGDQAQWDIWFSEAEELFRRKVMMPAIGNHEDNDPKYFEYYALPHAEDWYSFDYGNAHFTVLSTETDMGGNQRQWLEKDLASTNATWKFVLYHQPMYSSSSHGCYRKAYRAWGDLLDKYHVDMVFNGHDHTYERTLPMADDWMVDDPEDGTIHVVTGGAGAPLKRLVARGPWSSYFLSHYHFVLLTVDGTELHLEARFYNQTVFDELRLSKAVVPDLSVEYVKAEPRYPRPGGIATLVAGISNLGSKMSPAIVLDFRVNGDTLSTVSVPAMYPGESRKVETSWTPDRAGTHDLEAIADPENQIDEGLGEDDNVVLSYVVVAEPGADLVAEQIEAWPVIAEPGDPVRLRFTVSNKGSAPSAPFEMEMSIQGDGTYLEPVSGLNQGENLTVESTWNCSSGVHWISVQLDPSGDIPEIREDNNIRNRSFSYEYLRDSGPARLSEGFNRGGSAVLYYNQSQGTIPDNCTGVVVVWGFDGWKRPNIGCIPDNTYARGMFETLMDRVSDEMWMAKLPTAEDTGWIDIKFQDRQALPRYTDTNDGYFWLVPSVESVEELLLEYSEAIEKARSTGIEVRQFEEALESCNRTFQSGHCSAAYELLSEAIAECRRVECYYLIDAVRGDYQEALERGIDVARVNSFLVAAESQAEAGNYQGAKSYLDNARDFLEELDEGANIMAVPAILGLLSFLVAVRWRENL